MKVTNNGTKKSVKPTNVVKDIGAINTKKEISYTVSSFGERLVELRTENKLTQEESARRIGISRNALSMYERGERCANMDVAVNVANVYNVTLDYLFGTGYKSKTTNELGLYDLEFSEDTLDVLMDSRVRSFIDDVLSDVRFKKVIELIYSTHYRPFVNSYEVNYISRLISDLLYSIMVTVSKDTYKLRPMTDQELDELLSAVNQCILNIENKDYLLRTDYDAFTDCEDNIRTELERIKILLENSEGIDIETLKNEAHSSGFQEAIIMMAKGKIEVTSSSYSKEQNDKKRNAPQNESVIDRFNREYDELFEMNIQKD